jgi:NAD(P)-dependent dehydrogenase (short-subunit alcohol dehydrogenase family)
MSSGCSSLGTITSVSCYGIISIIATRLTNMTDLPASAGRRLEGKVAVVTGASRGIGAAICEILASKGCSLVMNYLANSSAEKCRQLGSELESKHNIQTVQIQADIGSKGGPERVVNFSKEAFQDAKLPGLSFQIDIIVNNASTGAILNLAESDIDSFATAYNLNTRGPMLLVKAALPYLPNDRSGRRINISSIASSLGLEGQTIYGGTKAALEAMTRTWSRELAERATVNAINLGWFYPSLYALIPGPNLPTQLSTEWYLVGSPSRAISIWKR